MRKAAHISDCQQYRYTLDRVWDEGKPTLVWLMLNPSTADAHMDDATMKRVIAFTENFGYGGLRVVNLYAYRSISPNTLKRVPDPVGPENDYWVKQACAGHDVVLAWGNHGKGDRSDEVLAVLGRIQPSPRLFFLAKTKSGQPGHPLYLPSELKMQRWEEEEAKPAKAIKVLSFPIAPWKKGDFEIAYRLLLIHERKDAFAFRKVMADLHTSHSRINRILDLLGLENQNNQLVDVRGWVSSGKKACQ